MSADADQRVAQAALKILRREYREFEEIFEYTVRVTGNELPVEPSNDIRNALSHLSSALRRNDKPGIERDITNCRGHIVLATSRCAVIAVTVMEAYMLAYCREAGASPEIQQQIFAIKGEREKIGLIEPIERHEPNGNVADLKALNGRGDALGSLLARCMELYQMLRVKHPLVRFPPPSAAFLARRRK